MNYILLTPIKNESIHLVQLKKTVCSQTLKPIFWIIIDSGSTDGSYEELKLLFSNEKWVHIIKQKHFFGAGYSHQNFAQAINEGYSYALNLCLLLGSSFEYVGKTDATPLLSHTYFETLLTIMQADPDLVITCGMEYVRLKNRLFRIKSVLNLSHTGFNDIRLYEKHFFEKVGGYPLTPSPDSVILVKAITHNYKILRVETTFFIKTRLGASKTGVWEGMSLVGRNMHILGYHPLLMLLSAFYLAFSSPPHYQFIPLFKGYAISVLKKDKQINDKDVISYFGKRRVLEIINRLIVL